MANTLTGLIPPLYEALDTVSREMVGFIPSVQRDTSNFARAAKGQMVTAFVTPTITGSDITPGVTAPNDGDEVLGTVNMTISKSRYWPIKWNGEEQLALNNNGPGVSPILVQQFQQAFRAGVNEVESSISAVAYTAASRATGTPGTTPFGTAGDLSDFANTAQILDDNGAPMIDRHLVVGSAAMANIRGKQSVLFKVNESGTDDMLRRGKVGSVEGFDMHFSPGVKAVASGSTGASFVTSGALAVGATTIPVGTGTGTVNPGDLVAFAGNAAKYDVLLVNGTTTAGQTPTNIAISSPGLRVAVGSGTAMTIYPSYTPNIGYTRDAFVLATRLPAVPIDYRGIASDMADDRQTIVDPFSGIAFEVALYRQYRQIRIEVGLAWGVATIKPEHVAILAG